ncbi:MAG: hypothetical protein WDN06_05135 [Asticcacaulis sp.]
MKRPLVRPLAVLADWQGHIIDARGSVARIAGANNGTRARYCA